MTKNLFDWIIALLIIFTIPLGLYVGDWLNLDKPIYYTEKNKEYVSFEQVKEPKPNHDYYSTSEYFLVKRRAFFPFTKIDTLNTLTNCCYGENRNKD